MGEWSRSGDTVAPDPVPLPTIPHCTVPLSGPWDAHTGNAAELRGSKSSCAGKGGNREWSRASTAQAGRPWFPAVGPVPSAGLWLRSLG